MPTEPQIDYKEAEQMLRRGMTRAEVAARFNVTPAAIGVAIMRGNIKVDYQKPQQRLPWKVRREHQRLNIPSMLRYAMRLEAGEGDRIPPAMLPAAQAFLDNLVKRGLVIAYDPESPEPWKRVKRRPGIDLGLVREPDAEAPSTTTGD